MNEILERVEAILKSEASLIIVNPADAKKISLRGNRVEKKAEDNRFELLKQTIESMTNVDDKFYSKIIQIVATYINLLYDREIDFGIVKVVNIADVFMESIYFNDSDSFVLKSANRELAGQVFEYVCCILENNKDITLNFETFNGLLNRNPRLFTLTVEASFIDRPFDFVRLARIISKQQMLKKSNITIDEIYQLLIDTCQIDKEDVFRSLVDPDEYKRNHKKVDEFLMWCNARVFVVVTKIIKSYYDSSFDRFAIVKQRNKNHFCEQLIMELLSGHGESENYDLIHQILTDSDIKIDYETYYADYIGMSDLKSLIALSGNRLVIEDLLSDEGNIQDNYWHEEVHISSYMLYAIIGDYEKAIVEFESQYDSTCDLNDEDNNWDRSGFAYGGWQYQDSLAKFIENICISLKIDGIAYDEAVKLINRILNSSKIKYVNLKETLGPIQEIFSPEDFKLLLDNLFDRQKTGNLSFLKVEDYIDMFIRYRITLADENEIKKQLDHLSELAKGRSMTNTKKEDTNK